MYHVLVEYSMVDCPELDAVICFLSCCYNDKSKSQMATILHGGSDPIYVYNLLSRLTFATGLDGNAGSNSSESVLSDSGQCQEASQYTVTAEERVVYETVLGIFDAFFQVRRNVIFERARFKKESTQWRDDGTGTVQVSRKL